MGINSATVERALDADLRMDCQLRNDIAEVIRAVKRGTDQEVLEAAKALEVEYRMLSELKEAA